MSPNDIQPGSHRLLERAKFPAPVDRDAVARSWRERGFSCGLFTDPPGREWIDFVHSTNEVVTVLRGKLLLEVSGESCVVHPGDELFIPRGARHSVRNIHEDTTDWLFGYD